MRKWQRQWKCNSDQEQEQQTLVQTVMEEFAN